MKPDLGGVGAQAAGTAPERPHHLTRGRYVDQHVNFFAVVEAPKIWMHEASIIEVGEDVPVASFRGWHPAVTEMIRAAASPSGGRCSACARCCAGTGAAS